MREILTPRDTDTERLLKGIPHEINSSVRQWTLGLKREAGNFQVRQAITRSQERAYVATLQRKTNSLGSGPAKGGNHGR